MATLEDLDAMEQDEKIEKDNDDKKDGDRQGQNGDADMKDVDGEKKEEDEDDIIDYEILHSSTQDINMRQRLIDNDMRIMKSEFQRLTHEKDAMREKIKDNNEKIENNRFALRNFRATSFAYMLILNLGSCHISLATLLSFSILM